MKLFFQGHTANRRWSQNILKVKLIFLLHFIEVFMLMGGENMGYLHELSFWELHAFTLLYKPFCESGVEMRTCPLLCFYWLLKIESLKCRQAFQWWRHSSHMLSSLHPLCQVSQTLKGDFLYLWRTGGEREPIESLTLHSSSGKRIRAKRHPVHCLPFEWWVLPLHTQPVLSSLEATKSFDVGSVEKKPPDTADP